MNDQVQLMCISCDKDNEIIENLKRFIELLN